MPCIDVSATLEGGREGGGRESVAFSLVGSTQNLLATKSLALHKNTAFIHKR